MELDGRTAIVTGAGRRVGRAIATALGLRQMHVAVLDWPQVQTGKPVDPINRATASNGK